MFTKIKSAASVHTSGLAEADIISNAKVSEHFGTTHGSINLEQIHSERRNQVSSFSSTAHDLTSALNNRDQDDYDADYAKALAEAGYQRYLDISLGIIKKSTIRVTLHENAYQFDKEGIIVLASDLSPSNIGELFYLLLNADAEFVSEGKVEVDSKAVEESIELYGTKLKTPRAKLKAHWITFSDSRSLSFMSLIGLRRKAARYSRHGLCGVRSFSSMAV